MTYQLSLRMLHSLASRRGAKEERLSTFVIALFYDNRISLLSCLSAFLQLFCGLVSIMSLDQRKKKKLGRGKLIVRNGEIGKIELTRPG